MNWDWLDADWVTPAVNVGTFLLALVTAITAVTAIFQTKKIIEQNEERRTQDSAEMLKSQERQEDYNRLAAESVKQQAISAKLQREAIDRATRPMMSARLLPPSGPKDPLDLQVSNVGKSTALDVEVHFDPPLPEGSRDALNANSDGLEASTSLLEITKNIFVDTLFPTWVPSQSVTSPFWILNKEYDVGDWNSVSAEGVPADQFVIVKYRDEQENRYEERFALQPPIWAGKMFRDSDSEKQRKAVEKLGGSIDKYGKAFVKDFAKLLDRTTQPTAEEEYRQKVWEKKIERIRRHEKRRKGGAPSERPGGETV